MNMVSSSSSSSKGKSPIDVYAVIEALTGEKIERRSSRAMSTDDYEHVRRNDDDDNNDDEDDTGREPKSDPAPEHEVNVGAINPYALVETMIGRKLDRNSVTSARIISDVLQTDYDELFDLKHESVLFAGLQLNEKERRAEVLKEKDVKILDERDLQTPDLSRVRRVEDLERIGVKDLNQIRVKMARMQNGKLRLVLDAPEDLQRTVSNHEVTMTLNELALPFRRGDKDNRREWQPPNGSWRDAYDTVFMRGSQRLAQEIDNFRIGENHGRMIGCNRGRRFDDPVQGATSNSWLIAAIFSIFWADPCIINRATRADAGRNNNDNNRRNNDRDERHRQLKIRFHDKGGENNNKTETVEVDYDIPVNNSTDEPIYCRASDGAEIWPALYEKAFAKWMTGNRNSRPDITQTGHGDPIKAMAQINGRDMQYYVCDRHSGTELAGIVRANSVNFKTINPMAAWTHASGRIYRGSNLVANHAYSVLGWTASGERQYVILRNPWGVTEPRGLASYPGLVDRVEPEFWRPACLLDQEGVIALEASAFKEYFQCIGVAK